MRAQQDGAECLLLIGMQALPSEPDAGEANVVQVAVRMPGGSRFTRRSVVHIVRALKYLCHVDDSVSCLAMWGNIRCV